LTLAVRVSKMTEISNDRCLTSEFDVSRLSACFAVFLWRHPERRN